MFVRFISRPVCIIVSDACPSRVLASALLCGLLLTGTTVSAAAEVKAGDVSLDISDEGELRRIRFSHGSDYIPPGPGAFCVLDADNEQIYPASVQASSDELRVRFEDGSKVAFTMQPHPGFTWFRLTDLDLKTSATGLRFPVIPVPSDASINPTLNIARSEGRTIGVLSASPEVLASNGNGEGLSADLKGCAHSFLPVPNTRSAGHAAEFVSTCTLPSHGWSMQGKLLEDRLTRDAVLGLKAWVYGDGKGQQLKFQLIDVGGGATDYYVTIDFTGWREITMTTPALHMVQGSSVMGLNLFYNGVPAKTTVRCLIDDVRALVSEAGTTHVVELATFEELHSPWWNDGARRLDLQWDRKYVRIGDSFGIIACAEEEQWDVISRFEKAAGILTPYPGNVWNKKSPVVKESYLFLTAFAEADFERSLELAKRGGFKHVLIEQHCWCDSTGHYNINKRNFPGGLDALVRTVNRFRENGISVGLHVLAASVDNNDPYITPVPDERLYKDAFTQLVTELDAETTTIIVSAMPGGFPAEDGGYDGDGTVLQIGSELIKYSSRTQSAPYTFMGCSRGHLGTVAAPHEAGAKVAHLARSYGYHMMDMDTSILDEVTSHFARVANACNIDMVYFDGSERLQGLHQRYNGRLVNAFLSRLNRTDIIAQASSYSHHSWHQLARTASADGHGDLKGYLEQRSPSFANFKQTGIALDVGWYYGYDTSATPDMYEYILGTTIGYGASFSFQVSPAAAKNHPFTMEILDLVARYEKLRLSGRVGENLQSLLRVDKSLMGKAPEDPSRDNSARRDYRLMQTTGTDVFQRVIYGEWKNGDATSSGTQWKLDITTGPVVVGVQMQALADKESKGIMNPELEIGGQVFRWNGTVEPGAYVIFWPGEQAKSYAAQNRQENAALSPTVTLEPGTYTVRVKCAAGGAGTYRTRVNLLTPESHVIP